MKTVKNPAHQLIRYLMASSPVKISSRSIPERLWDLAEEAQSSRASMGWHPNKKVTLLTTPEEIRHIYQNDPEGIVSGFLRHGVPYTSSVDELNSFLGQFGVELKLAPSYIFQHASIYLEKVGPPDHWLLQVESADVFPSAVSASIGTIRIKVEVDTIRSSSRPWGLHSGQAFPKGQRHLELWGQVVDIDGTSHQSVSRMRAYVLPTHFRCRWEEEVGSQPMWNGPKELSTGRRIPLPLPAVLRTQEYLQHEYLYRLPLRMSHR